MDSSILDTAADSFVMATLSKLPTSLLQVAANGPPSWNTVFKALFLTLALVNIKSLPLMWHFRFYRSLFHHLLRHRSHHPAPTHLFSPITSTSRSPFYECDMNLHKSNSTYFSDLDIARTHLICHLIKRSLRTRRSLYVALAGVSCLFRREIKPFEKYEIVSRVLGWDNKWIWVVSHFVSLRREKDKDGRLGQRKIFASALSKYVFKAGRLTVKPEEILSECQLLPSRPEGALASSTAVANANANANGNGNANGVVKVNGAARLSEKELLKRLDNVSLEKPDGYWTWERVEAERARGCEIAQCMLMLDKLEDEIRTGEEEGLTKIGHFY